MSIRSVQRITGLHQETILNLIVLAGERCEKLFETRIKGIAVKDVEADELWQFVQCKNRHKLFKGITDPHVGDSYTWIGIERNTKLILTWRFGTRDMTDCEAFTEKLHAATSGNFQLTTDGYARRTKIRFGIHSALALIMRNSLKSMRRTAKASKSIRHQRWWKQLRK